MPKRVRSDINSAAESKSPKKKARNDISVLSANTCGFDSSKWAKLEKIADDKQIDMVVMQEGPRPGVADDIIDSSIWDLYSASEYPDKDQLTIEGKKASYTFSQGKNYLTAVRKSSKKERGLSITAGHYKPTRSPRVCKLILGDNAPPKRDASKRVPKRPVSDDKVRLLGLRAPQALQLTVPGCQSVALFNYHAPQGSGSSVGYSGMDAKSGHDLMSEYMKDDGSAEHMLVGDQNAEVAALKSHYHGYDVISAGRKDKLSHAVCSSGLHAEKIDLDGAGDEFNSKGSKGCSDHSAYAFKFCIPETK